MAAYNKVAAISAIVPVDAAGVPAVDRYRFAKWDDTAGFVDSQVTAATGVADIVAGILASPVDTKLRPGVAYKAPAVPLVIGSGGIALVELGEAVTDLDVMLRPGTLGKAFLADATGDRKVAQPLETGVIGQIIRVQLFAGGGQLVP